MLTARRAPLGWVASAGLVAVTGVGAYFGTHPAVVKCEDESHGKLGRSICSSLGTYSDKGPLLWLLLVAPPILILLVTRMLPAHRTRPWIFLVWGAVISTDALLHSLISAG
jgi:hypothetical protein